MDTLLTSEEREERIQELHEEKAKLLDRYGVFGGGWMVTELHANINFELEALGVDANS